jgi:tripartite-type tricarboxylate transporter receptor subunit TctC
LPTVAESGVPGYAAESWYGLYAPAKTPGPIIERLNKAVAKAVQSAAFKRLESNEGLIMVGSPPEALDRYVQDEEARWRKLIKDSNIKAE